MANHQNQFVDIASEFNHLIKHITQTKLTLIRTPQKMIVHFSGFKSTRELDTSRNAISFLCAYSLPLR